MHHTLKTLSMATLFALAMFAPSRPSFAQQGDAQPSAAQLPLTAYYAPAPVSDFSVSPDGRHIAYLAVSSVSYDESLVPEQAVRQVLVFVNADNPAGEPVYTLDATRLGINAGLWLSPNHYMFSGEQTARGGTVGRSYLLDLRTKQFREVPDIGGVNRSGSEEVASETRQAMIVNFLPSRPDHVLMAWRDPDQSAGFPIYELNLETGASRLILRPRTSMGVSLIDDDGDPRVAQSYANGVMTYYARLKGESEWRVFHRDRLRDREGFGVIGLSPSDPNKVWVSGYFGGEFRSIHEMDLATGEIGALVFSAPRGDVIAPITRFRGGRIEFVGVQYDTPFDDRGFEYAFMDQDEGRIYALLQARFPNGRFNIASRSDDDSLIVVQVALPERPGGTYLLRNRSELVLLAQARPTLANAPASQRSIVTYTARDGMRIEGYLSIPAGASGAGPTIIMPHGGPWVRDYFVYHPWVDMLTSRGYRVFQPNYRGSTGYGATHWRAGDGQWGLTMQDDLDDAAAYLVAQGVADPNHLIMYGFSYGGYAAMMAPVRDNPPYVCAIAGAGVSNLDKIRRPLFSSRIAREIQYDQVGGLSPEHLAANASIPLLLLHGGRDRIVPLDHSQDYARALERHGKDVRLVELPQAAHEPGATPFEQRVYYSELFDFLEKRCAPRHGG